MHTHAGELKSEIKQNKSGGEINETKKEDEQMTEPRRLYVRRARNFATMLGLLLPSFSRKAKRVFASVFARTKMLREK